MRHTYTRGAPLPFFGENSSAGKGVIDAYACLKMMGMGLGRVAVVLGDQAMGGEKPWRDCNALLLPAALLVQKHTPKVPGHTLPNPKERVHSRELNGRTWIRTTDLHNVNVTL